ncbi:hypothetical protein M2337_000541 [Sphingobium sp. B2D3A]|nr:hypothetical protein [Sphingobium sp. B2D3A]MCW2386062.1 hypothetical protein [Sphingobium sp. B2D3D]
MLLLQDWIRHCAPRAGQTLTLIKQGMLIARGVVVAAALPLGPIDIQMMASRKWGFFATLETSRVPHFNAVYSRYMSTGSARGRQR